MQNYTINANTLLLEAAKLGNPGFDRALAILNDALTQIAARAIALNEPEILAQLERIGIINHVEDP